MSKFLINWYDQLPTRAKRYLALEGYSVDEVRAGRLIAKHAGDIERLQRSNRDLESRLAQLQQRIEQVSFLEPRVASLETTVKRLEARLANAEERLNLESGE